MTVWAQKPSWKSYFYNLTAYWLNNYGAELVNRAYPNYPVCVFLLIGPLLPYSVINSQSQHSSHLPSKTLWNKVAVLYSRIYDDILMMLGRRQALAPLSYPCFIFLHSSVGPSQPFAVLGFHKKGSFWRGLLPEDGPAPTAVPNIVKENSHEGPPSFTPVYVRKNHFRKDVLETK